MYIDGWWSFLIQLYVDDGFFQFSTLWNCKFFFKQLFFIISYTIFFALMGFFSQTFSSIFLLFLYIFYCFFDLKTFLCLLTIFYTFLFRFFMALKAHWIDFFFLIQKMNFFYFFTSKNKRTTQNFHFRRHKFILFFFY